jgi:hypothetical protein
VNSSLCRDWYWLDCLHVGGVCAPILLTSRLPPQHWGDLRGSTWPLRFVNSATSSRFEGEDQWQQSYKLTQMGCVPQLVAGR